MLDSLYTEALRKKGSINNRIEELIDENIDLESVWRPEKVPSSDKKLVFLIGGPYGIAPEVKAAANTLWSLSKLTFPHEIARLLLCEQLFRAMNIANGGSYHHE